MSVPWQLGSSSRLFLQFHCFSFAGPIVCDKMLGNVEQWLDDPVIGIVAIAWRA